MKHLVAPLWIGIVDVFENPGTVGAGNHQVVRCAPFVTHQAQAGFLPVEPIARHGITDAHIAVGWRTVRGCQFLLTRHAQRGVINNERIVPALIKAFGIVVENVGVKVVKTLLPRLVFPEQRVAGVLCDRAQL